MTGRGSETKRRSQRSSRRRAKAKMHMIFHNPNRDVEKTFVDEDFIAMCLLIFGRRPGRNCPQVKRTGCLNRRVAKCFAKYLLAEKLLGCTTTYTGQAEIEEDVESRLLNEFLGMRVLFSKQVADLTGEEITDFITAAREDGENDACYARKNGIACYGLPSPASEEAGDPRTAGSCR